VQFFRSAHRPPQNRPSSSRGSRFDHLLGERVRFPTDLLVLVVRSSCEPGRPGSYPTGKDSFYMGPQSSDQFKPQSQVYTWRDGQAPKTCASRWLRPWLQPAKPERSWRAA
jgi:hypothetical protein